MNSEWSRCSSSAIERIVVSSADEIELSAAEDTTIRSIADELHLDHSEFIAVKSAYGSLLATRSRTDETP